MGYDLKPRNKPAGWHHARGWSWMLEAGVGLPVGHGRGYTPGTFIYSSRPDGRSLGYNDGARVTAKEARQMAQIARWIAEHQGRVYEQWMLEPEQERARMVKNDHRIYEPPIRRDFITGLMEFADWAEKSGGFRVY